MVTNEELRQFATEIRLETVKCLKNRGFGHVGGCLSVADVLAAQFISHYKLDHVVAFVDWNKRQVDGYVEGILSQGDMEKKFEAFGWYAVTVDGKDSVAIRDAIVEAKKQSNGRAIAIILDGIKGAGVPEYETMFDNHFFNLDQDEAEKVIANLETRLGR